MGWLCLVTGRAAERAEEPWEKAFTREARAKIFKLIYNDQSINGIGSAYLSITNHESVTTQSVHSSSSDNAMESERKRNSVKLQPREV